MWEALIVLAMGFSVGGATVWLLGGAILGRFSQRCTRLETAVEDLQNRALSVKGKEMSEKRWSKRDADDAELAQILKEAPTSRRKYDNDPLG
jgi:predicted dienelactone hydrolase